MNKREKNLIHPKNGEKIGKGFIVCAYCGATLDEISEKIQKILHKKDKNKKSRKPH